MGNASDQSPPGGRASRIRRWLPLAVLLAGAVLFFALGFHRFLTFDALRDHRAMLAGWVHERQVAAAIVFVVAYAVVVALSLPVATLLTLAAGFLFGTILASLYVVVGATIGALAVFLAARTAFGDMLRKRASGFVGRMAEGFRRNQFSYLLFLRLVPVFPFWLVNIVPAFLGVSTRTYVVATVLGIVPGTVVYAAVGNGLGAVFDQGSVPDLGIIFRADILLPILGLAVLSLVPPLVGHWKGRRS